MSTKIRFDKDIDNKPAVSADVDHGAVNTEKEDNINLGLVQQGSDVSEEMKLDDARRVKAVSPGLLVVKRFFRNKLAMVGLGILVVLFLFCFLGAAIYPYSQSQTFTTYKTIQVDYAFGKINEDYVKYVTPQSQAGRTLQNMMNSYIATMKAEGLSEMAVTDTSSDLQYKVVRLKDEIYSLALDDTVHVATLALSAAVGTYTANKMELNLYLNSADSALSDALTADWNAKGKKVASVSVAYGGNTYTLRSNKIVCTYPELTEIAAARQEGVTDAMVAEARTHLGDEFAVDGVTYRVSAYTEGVEKGYYLDVPRNDVALYSTTLSFDRYDLSKEVPTAFRLDALAALGGFDEADDATHAFVSEGVNYTIRPDGDAYIVAAKTGAETVDYMSLSAYSIRRYTGEDTISVATKRAFRVEMDAMSDAGKTEGNITVRMESLDEDGNYIYDENGVLQFDDEEFYVKTEQKGFGQQFVFRNKQAKLVADIYAKPSKDHILGLDSNAMDVLARIMYGGRISLMIGFIVVFIEIILGSIMGGISGYFGGIIDNIIMRIVDIFYCIPTMPILIILGAMFNTLKLDNMLRVVYMMMVLGFLGWPGIARLVRGQILSLREQDYMIAAEASGLTAKRKIAKHLIPNVIPQLIVQATMGLGGVILTESTLSFLGLGVKFPMATWGQIINSVSSINDMQTYTYIWIPVGALICLAVIAFNFVGDGLRDAFDPKMSR